MLIDSDNEDSENQFDEINKFLMDESNSKAALSSFRNTNLVQSEHKSPFPTATQLSEVKKTIDMNPS